MVARLLLVMMACSLVFVAPVGTSPAEAKKRKTTTTTVTRTFRSEGGVTIPDSANAGPGTKPMPSPYPLPIKVKGFKKAKIVDVDVTLVGLYHPLPDNLDILLFAPNGRDAMLMSDAGGAHPPKTVTITFSDQASQFLPDSGPLASGAFQTTNYGVGGHDDSFPYLIIDSITGNRLLSTFNGSNPNGRWSLYVMSDGFDTGGAIGSVELKIMAKVKKR
ncbi:MAG: hypothetical protein IT338_06410 [Thermomicrobiales bacterium]|nr:hypothetical protein [Thermomicrobiales bacterium]